MNRTALLVTLLLAGVGALHSGVAAQITPAKVVLELFTSQGCSSCPPADALFAAYAKRDDVIALSVPVDYWDRLGWKDTYASPDHTLRQRQYAQARGDGQVYTPQIVVSGTTHVVGSSQRDIDHAIVAARKTLGATQVPVAVRLTADVLVIEIGAAPHSTVVSSARVLLAAVQDFGTVSIGRGENANRTVTYYNIVRSLKPIGTWTGAASTLRVARKELAIQGAQSVVALLQNGAGGAIVGAARVRIAGQS
ncbi:MAG: DUF1223 domain-containing protein [Hyphomonadaceae bacterium]|nr:DUF1223 domain-containing protein [Hyphomonadaceae bacterium]